MFEAIAILLIAPAAIPLWVAVWLLPALRPILEPQRRADLATTPTDPREYLRRAVGLRVHIARLPAVLGALAVASGVIAAADEISGPGRYDALAVYLAYASILVGAFIVFAERLAAASVWTSARHACERAAPLSLLRSFAGVVLRTIGVLAPVTAVVALAVIIAHLAIDHFALVDTRKLRELLSVMSGTAVVTAACILAHLRERAQWRRLAEAYLVLEPAERA